MEDFMKIKAESRTEVGKKIAKKLRREGMIPAVIYGEHKEAIPISVGMVDVKAILKTEKKENTVLNIQRDDIKVDAMLKEVQYDYLSENIIHADFIRIDVTHPVNISVPIEVEGEPIGVKVEDGFFDFMTREVRVRCLPPQIPVRYKLDVSGMHAGQSIKAEDIDLGEDIKLLNEPHTVICSVTSKGRADDDVEEGEEEAEEATAE
jgi:large subunit ribosomal protein L25